MKFQINYLSTIIILTAFLGNIYSGILGQNIMRDNNSESNSGTNNSIILDSNDFINTEKFFAGADTQVTSLNTVSRLRNYFVNERKMFYSDDKAANLQLENNNPNPFNTETDIIFTLKNPARVKLVICNFLGKELEVLIDKVIENGNYNIKWNASEYPDGTYFYRIISGNFSQTRKMYLIK